MEESPQRESNIVHEKQILEAIDQLRRRKARPDADRICNYLLRRHSVDARVTISDLHRLIEAEKVIQVDYKGHTSYRNASKWSRLQLYKNRPEGFVKEKYNSNMVASAFAVLLIQEPDYLEQGVPAYRLIDQLLAGAVSTPTSRKIVEDFLSKEVASGNVTRMSNGNYSLVAPTETSPDKQESQPKINGNSMDYTENNGSASSSLQQSPMAENENSKNTVQLSLKEPVKKEESTTIRRSSKGERKQRLLVRPDDSMDLEIKFQVDDDDDDDDNNDEEKKPAKRPREPENEENTESNSANKSPTQATIRSARRKRAKKVFDPSDSNIPKKKRGRQPAAKPTQAIPELPENLPKANGKEANRQCSLCAKGKAEQLVSCRDCTVRAHPGCIWSREEVTQEAKARWQCERCKSCTVCCETSDAGALITCTVCHETYHYVCHTPRVPSSKSHAKWHCQKCNEKKTEKATAAPAAAATAAAATATAATVATAAPAAEPSKKPAAKIQSPVIVPTQPAQSPDKESGDQKVKTSLSSENTDPNIPDASKWTPEEVYHYFSQRFPREAEVFRIQSIDGASLLLMKRHDVLTSLNLLLGPALKIYRHIVRLQTRSNDPYLCWF